MQFEPAEKYKFDEFQLDVPKRQLLREGSLVTLNPKAFDLLLVLVQHSGKLLSKDDLFRLVWEDQIVEESNLTVNMSQVRKALGEKASQPRYIATVSGQGYRFVGNGRKVSDDQDESHIENQKSSPIAVEEENHKTSKPAAASAFSNRKQLIFGAALLVVILLIGGGYLWRSKSGVKKISNNQPIAMRRLTNFGNVTSAALSPDGKLYAYVLSEKDGRQSLWLGHIDGGNENIQLRPPEESIYFGLNFAPDGSSIYYNIGDTNFRGGTIFKIKVFGSIPEKVYENVGGYMTFAPDGKQFVFVRDDEKTQKSSLIIADLGGAAERELVSRPLNLPFISTSIAWSPDGSRIAASAVNDENGSTNEVFVTTVKDGVLTPLTKLGWNGIPGLVWEPDGTGLYSVAGARQARWESQIWHISYPEGEAVRVVSDLNVYGSILGLSAADPSKLLVFQSQQYSNVWVAPADNLSAAKQITNELLGKRSGWDGLGWTADGKLLFTAFSDTNETVWEMDADGKNQKPVIPEGRINTHFSLSADGRKIVFDSNRNGGWEIWTANADGSELRQITTGGHNTQPHFSPDGNWIVYRSVRSGLVRLWRTPTTGGDPLQVSENAASWARYSPDGKAIACAYAIDGKTKLALLNPENGQPQKIFEIPPTTNFNNGIRWSPDGQAITYRDWSNGIWRQELTGGEPHRLTGLPEEKLYTYDWSRDGKSFAFTRGTEIRDVVLILNLQ